MVYKKFQGEIVKLSTLNEMLGPVDRNGFSKVNFKYLATEHLGASEGLQAVERLRLNIAKLEDLHGRLRFMLSEIETLNKRQ